ncbi:hypothetical protein K458DRAFT_412108 [Lentithecium fluviatile CBS 122367]|uniref:GPI anchored serine-threonine rich protein n=1 Tax=Lentithecium fluviatile CBS 122367 TaxID=1168545 RepID=A0A6G1JKT7_9PLEO|nr:hypothetical protein K458DRAFT_412108 [Lentithecium fluviatile CBS 122367]
MRFAAAFALAAASFVVAQTTTHAAPSASATSSSCDAQNILDTCKGTQQTQIDKCEGNDWMCLCDNYTNLLTCYNNCPNDPVKSSVQNQVTQFCAAAAPLSSSSLSVAATASKASSTSTSATATGSGTASDATASATPFNTGNSAPGMVAPIGGAFAVLLGIAGML